MSAPTPIPNDSKNARGNREGVDRLSSLSDELLHHMMSFLPMPEVVRTSLFSPRWRNLWASTPFIHIDCQDFMHETDPLLLDFDKIEKFGDHLLLLRDGAVCLDEARIFVPGPASKKSSVWICHAIKHKVRVLHIYGSNYYSVLGSTAMFPSQHLKRITLKSLLLRHRVFRMLNCSFPKLEYLELDHCTFVDREQKEISLMSLKVLRIIGGSIVDGLLICARNLTHLSILDPDCLGGAIVTRDLSSLVKASISLSSKEFHYGHTDLIVDGRRLLDGLSHATTLELHAPLHELAFERGLQTCPMFNNLTNLVLGDWCMAADLYPLVRILQRSSNLKELNLKLKMEECTICKNSESALLSSPSSITGVYPSLERIKIYCRKGDPRIGALFQALLPIINPDGELSIKHC